MVTMAQRIEALRTEKGLSRPALAAALGLPRLSIEKFETGRQTPSQEQQQKLAGAFGVSLPYLRGETDDPTSMDNWLSGAVPQEDVVLPKAVRKATAAVVAQSGDSSKSDGAVFSALLKSDSFKALVRETVLDVLKSPEGQALLAKAAAVPRSRTEPDQWEFQILARILSEHTVIMVTTDCDHRMLRDMHLRTASSLGEALEQAYALVGANASVAVIPDGVSVIAKKL